jgi:5-methylcytosine-specific restriction endonuclease McrA
MTEHDIAYVKQCIQEDMHRFYVWSKWKAIRAAVLEMDKNECQMCKSRGQYTRATTVHHVNYVKRHPDKALEIWYTFRGQTKRNLISLCHNCHEEIHGYRKKEKKKPLTEERWE